MSYERIPSNRERVFEIYGIDPEDERYNCHHIVMRTDFKHGTIVNETNVNSKSNLYPIRKELHVILHKIINAAENGEDIKPLILYWREVEESLLNEDKLEEIKIRESQKRKERISLYQEQIRLKNGSTIGQRIPQKTMARIIDVFPDLQPCYGTI